MDRDTNVARTAILLTVLVSAPAFAVMCELTAYIPNACYDCMSGYQSPPYSGYSWGFNPSGGGAHINFSPETPFNATFHCHNLEGQVTISVDTPQTEENTHVDCGEEV